MNENIHGMISEYQNMKISEQTKVREILQQTALLGLQRHGFFEKAAFYGGTALRILYGLDRFSEDLDFTLLKSDPKFHFEPYLVEMKNELKSFGFDMEVTQKAKNIETSVLSAFLKGNTIQCYVTIGEEKKAKSINHNEKIQIKIEVDTDPPGHFRVENHNVLFPTPFPILTLHKSDLFAGKMHALLYRAWKGRVKGRDWYDFIWYLQQKIPLNIQYLEACMKQAKTFDLKKKLTKQQLLDLLKDKIQKLDWQSAKDDMKAFIADPQRVEIWSPQFFTSLLDSLRMEK